MRQVKLTRQLEAPIAVVPQIKLVEYANANSPALGDRVPPGPIPNFCRALVSIQNSGRSPLRIINFCIEWQVSANIPTQPQYRHFEQWDSLIGPNQGSWAMATTMGDIQLNAAQRTAVQNQQEYLWVFGFFSYSTVFGEAYNVGFLGRWDLARGLQREPNPHYEYYRQIAYPH